MKPTLLILAALLTGCLSTNTGNPSTDKIHATENAVGKVAAQVVWNFALSSAENFVAQKIGADTAHSLFQAVGQIRSASDLAAAVTDPKLADIAVRAFTAANPQTPAQKAAVVNSIAAALQTASNSGSGVFDGRP